MKLFILFNIETDDIIAISEDKTEICQYYLQNNFHSDKYKIFKEKDKFKIDYYLIQYEDKYLHELEDHIVTADIYQSLIKYSDEMENRIEDTIKNLSMIHYQCNLSSKEKKSIDKTIKILMNKSSNEKEFNLFINIKKMISKILKRKSFKDIIIETYSYKDIYK